MYKPPVINVKTVSFYNGRGKSTQPASHYQAKMVIKRKVARGGRKTWMCLLTGSRQVQ